MAPKAQAVEEKYKKVTQIEHILLRPDSYVGSLEHTTEKIHVLNKKDNIMEQQQITYSPALYKIFDEILVNAADNFQRDPKGMSEIRVVIDRREGMISIKNNGETLPVTIHKEHKCYVPELVFGHLLTSDNYDDANNKRVTGGRNGYGAKLTNIFSTKFQIECCDVKKKKLYRQEWNSNMGVKGKPEITPLTGDESVSHTTVTFYPDLPKFKMKVLSNDIMVLFERRIYDIAGTTDEKVKVYYNDQRIKVTGFKDYVDLYLGEDDQGNVTKVYDKCGKRWEIAMSISDSGQFQQVSFCNSICTLKGGTHVAHVTDQLIDAISKKVNKENKSGMEIKPAHIRNHLMIFVNALIENPSFDAQTKETLKTNQRDFGSTCDIKPGFIDRVMKTGVTELILQWARAREKIDLGKQVRTKNTKRLTGIPKLEDANDAGGKDSEDCTLILTEGDSAKALAVAGLSVVGRDKFGVFPLKGKPLNVRDADFKKTMNNEEISNVLKIMGLDPRDHDREDTKGLRYGSIMIMADQDYDGSHIKGLLLNMLEHWFPKMLKLPGFIREFITPIVKVSKGGVTKSFFTVGEYEEWKLLNNNGKGWNMKYYKGLGTSTSKEAKEYFKNIEDHGMTFDWDEGAKESIDMAFNKKRADDRKEWINNHEEGQFIDHTQPSMTYTDFVYKELVLFSKYDIHRMIPNLVDGLKPSQRKVLFSCFKRKLTKDVKVAQLSGYISEHAAYHHGEMSLQQTIVNMAQDFVGSNNINLLMPSGQFGTRLQGGKDAASARYIFTRLNTITRKIFHPDDDPILEHLDEEGQRIEPKHYYPIIPMTLVNGAEGIGTGWSTNIPNFNPKDLVNCIRKYIAGQKVPELVPWYRGFKGDITASDMKDGWVCTGKCSTTGNTIIEIKELPIKKWTQDYKDFLLKKLPAAQDDASKAAIQDFREYHTDSSVHFVITLTAAQMQNIVSKTTLVDFFRLSTALNTSNMVLWSPEGQIKKYSTAMEIVEAFAPVRLQYYHKRKKNLLVKLRRECEILRQKVNFITQVIEEQLVVRKKKKEVLIVELQKKGFLTKQQIYEKYFDEFTNPMKKQIEEEEEEAAATEGDKKGGDKKSPGGGYEYLMGMPMWSLTAERVEELLKQFREKETEVKVLENTSPEDIWDKDLVELSSALNEMDLTLKLQADEEAKLLKGKKGKALTRQEVARRKGTAARRRKAEITKEDVPDSDAEESPSKKRQKLNDFQVEAMLKPPTAEESSKDFLARLQEKHKQRMELNQAMATLN